MIAFELNQSILRGGQRMPIALVEKVVSACARELRPKVRVELSLAFVDGPVMRSLNKKWRGHDYVTDVLSFETTNEILLCYPQAVRQAKEMGHSTRDELVFLLVHGILHTFGFDHMKPRDAQKMFPLQTRILKKLGIDPRL